MICARCPSIECTGNRLGRERAQLLLKCWCWEWRKKIPSFFLACIQEIKLELNTGYDGWKCSWGPHNISLCYKVDQSLRESYHCKVILKWTESKLKVNWNATQPLVINRAPRECQVKRKWTELGLMDAFLDSYKQTYFQYTMPRFGINLPSNGTLKLRMSLC